MIGRLRKGVAWLKHQASTAEIQQQMLQSLNRSLGAWPVTSEYIALPSEESTLKALLITAHPDDESECAATIYRITHELGGIVDQLIVTDGAGGHRYSAPAGAYYELSQGEQSLPTNLARVRRKELLRAGRILAIRHHYFLEESDTGVTLDPLQGFEAWNVKRVRSDILTLLEFESYDLVFLLLPTTYTHGHHQTVAVLALDVISRLPIEHRPAAVGVETATSETAGAKVFSGLEHFPLTRTARAEPDFKFDRRTPMLCDAALEYSIVVNWVIAEHKSQGMFQMEFGRRNHEYFWLFDASGKAGAARWRRFLEMSGSAVSSQRDCEPLDSIAKGVVASG